jgi:hypothetical protein
MVFSGYRCGQRSHGTRNWTLGVYKVVLTTVVSMHSKEQVDRMLASVECPVIQLSPMLTCHIAVVRIHMDPAMVAQCHPIYTQDDRSDRAEAVLTDFKNILKRDVPGIGTIGIAATGVYGMATSVFTCIPGEVANTWSFVYTNHNDCFLVTLRAISDRGRGCTMHVNPDWLMENAMERLEEYLPPKVGECIR